MKILKVDSIHASHRQLTYFLIRNMMWSSLA
jgi:hypothetical protein